MLLVTFVPILPVDTGFCELAIHLRLYPSASDAVCFLLGSNLKVELERFGLCDKERGILYHMVPRVYVCVCFGRCVHSKHPYHTTEADKQICFSHTHTLACAAAVTELAVSSDGGEFGQRLLVSGILASKPAHWIPYIWVVENLGIARYRPLKRWITDPVGIW
jgi:hypothetical protein